MAEETSRPALDYHATSFSQGRMDFEWEELDEAAIHQAYADWEAGRGLIGGDPRRIPNAHLLPDWALDQPFFRALALTDERSSRNAEIRTLLASDHPLEIEIGFGRGDFLLDRAQRYPQRLFIGYETKTKAARLMLQRLGRLELENLWISDDDCRFSLPRIIEDGRVDALHVLFPDPWWKPQHQVKRLFSPPFVDLVATKLRPGGLLYFKSDVREYGEYVAYLLNLSRKFAANNPAASARIGEYAPTHREFWCIERERPIYTFYFERSA